MMIMMIIIIMMMMVMMMTVFDSTCMLFRAMNETAQSNRVSNTRVITVIVSRFGISILKLGLRESRVLRCSVRHTPYTVDARHGGIDTFRTHAWALRKAQGQWLDIKTCHLYKKSGTYHRAVHSLPDGCLFSFLIVM